MKTYKLAADTVNGVYLVDEFEQGVGVITSNFIVLLAYDFEGVIFGEVSQAEYEEIDRQYGIRAY